MKSVALEITVLCCVFLLVSAELKQDRHFARDSDLFSFNCPALPPRNQTANKVSDLHAQDIKVVLALGDSITAGFGILGERHSIPEDLYEYRGLSWTIGGDANATTIANFFRRYQPEQQGASHGEHELEFCVPHLCLARHHPELDVLNAAMSGAMVYNFVHGDHNQIDYLEEQLKRMRDVIDFENDWKMLNLFIGANDMCVRCDEVPIFPTSPDDYETYFRDTLMALKQRIPRLFVNVMLLFNVSEIYQLSLRSAHCMEVRRLAPVECECAFHKGEKGDEERKNIDETAVAYNQRLEKVVHEMAANKSDDFAVVIQPALRDLRLENLPLDFINMLDCFHPSLVGHSALAKVIWNNMWVPAAKKKTNFDYKAPFFCPTADSTLQLD